MAQNEDVAIEVRRNEARTRGGNESEFDPNMAVQVCWSVSAFQVCIDSWQSNELVIGIYLAGVRIAGAKLNANNPCARFKADVGVARVDAEICIDIVNRNVRAKGEVCVTFACVRFNQVIFTW
jgi:hypothetical protein